MKLQYMDILTAFYPMAFNLMFDEFLLEKNYSHIHCDFLIITFLNDLPHSMNVTSYGVSSLFSNVFNILHMLQHKMFLEFLNAIPHSTHVLSYSINNTYLSYVSGQGLPHASDNVKYWSFVRSPLRFTSSSHSIQV